ncbi:hypothetical protein [Scopulibacillus daqui]|uniref:hypothetical protein n=1 Tax=Scopulibacillus daqui TaxID=1469162 RepID=UPI0019609C05|nr:hypothetical protein [Scopulibacillus daqui]
MVGKDKYKWLLAGFRNRKDDAKIYYSLLGGSMIVGSVIDDPCVNGFILPMFVILLSIITMINAAAMKRKNVH